MTADTQLVQHVNWWLEAFRVGLPVLATIIVGWLIARSNERLKTDLAKELANYQTRYAPHHQARLAAITKIYPVIERIRELMTLGNVRDMNLLYQPVKPFEEMIAETRKLKDIVAESGIYFDHSVIKLIGTAYSYSLLLGMSDQTVLSAQAFGVGPDEMASLISKRDELRTIVESAVDDLEAECRAMVAPDAINTKGS